MTKVINIDALGAGDGTLLSDYYMLGGLPDIAIARFALAHLEGSARVVLRGKTYQKIYDECGLFTGRVEEVT